MYLNPKILLIFSFFFENLAGSNELCFQLWLVETPAVFQATTIEQKNRWLSNLRDTISHVSLQSETRIFDLFIYSFYF